MSRVLVIACSAMGRGRGSFLLWLVNAGSAVSEPKRGGGGASGGQATSTAERSRAVKALGGAIEMDERVLGHVDVQAAVRASVCMFVCFYVIMCMWGTIDLRQTSAGA